MVKPCETIRECEEKSNANGDHGQEESEEESRACAVPEEDLSADPAQAVNGGIRPMEFDAHRWHAPRQLETQAPIFWENIPWTPQLGRPKDFVPRNYAKHEELCSIAEHPAVGTETIYFFNFSPLVPGKAGSANHRQNGYSWYAQFRDMLKKNAFGIMCGAECNWAVTKTAGRRKRSRPSIRRTSGKGRYS